MVLSLNSSKSSCEGGANPLGCLVEAFRCWYHWAAKALLVAVYVRGVLEDCSNAALQGERKDIIDGWRQKCGNGGERFKSTLSPWAGGTFVSFGLGLSWS